MKAIDIMEKIEEAASTSYCWSLYKDHEKVVDAEGQLKVGPNGAMTDINCPKCLDSRLVAPKVEGMLVSQNDPWADATADGFSEFVDGMQRR